MARALAVFVAGVAIVFSAGTSVASAVPLVPQSSTPTIVSIVASCNAQGSACGVLTVAFAATGQTVTLKLTAHQPGSSTFTDTGSTTTITMVTGQSKYDFCLSIPSAYRDRTVYNTLRVEVASTSVTMNGTTTMSVSFSCATTTPTTTTPTTTTPTTGGGGQPGAVNPIVEGRPANSTIPPELGIEGTDTAGDPGRFLNGVFQPGTFIWTANGTPIFVPAAPGTAAPPQNQPPTVGPSPAGAVAPNQTTPTSNNTQNVANQNVPGTQAGFQSGPANVTAPNVRQPGIQNLPNTGTAADDGSLGSMAAVSLAGLAAVVLRRRRTD